MEPLALPDHPPRTDPDIAAAHGATLDWLLGRINYERVPCLPYSAGRLKLERMRELLARLGNPQQRMRALWLTAYGAFGLVLFGYRASLLGTLLAFHYFNLSNVVVAVFFGRISDWLSRHPRVWQHQRWFTASVLGGLALHLALSARR